MEHIFKNQVKKWKVIAFVEQKMEAGWRLYYFILSCFRLQVFIYMPVLMATECMGGDGVGKSIINNNIMLMCFTVIEK